MNPLKLVEKSERMPSTIEAPPYVNCCWLAGMISIPASTILASIFAFTLLIESDVFATTMIWPLSVLMKSSRSPTGGVVHAITQYRTLCAEA